MDIPSQQSLTAQIQVADKTVQGAGEYFNKTQERMFENIAKGLQQLSIVAAGTISLSITFLGYLINAQQSIGRDMLSLNLWGAVPILWVLFVSWLFLFITIVLGLVYPFVNAWYWISYTGHEWAKGGIAHWSTRLTYVTAGYDFEFSDAPNRFDGIAQMQENKTTWESVVSKYKSSCEFYAFLTRYCRRTAIASFVIGLIILFIFIVAAVSNLALV